MLEYLDVVAVHGFPLDWNRWSVHAWPDKLAEIQAVTHLPVWVSETGASYYRHFCMGLLREDGTPQLALEPFAQYTPDLGICQWFHFEDHRLDDAVQWLRRLGVTSLRTGVSWADSLRPQALAWFDRQMQALEEFDVTLTFCFTLEQHRHCRYPTRRLFRQESPSAWEPVMARVVTELGRGF